MIRAKHDEGSSFTEIGAALEMSPNTAKSCYSRVLERLRGELLAPLREVDER